MLLSIVVDWIPFFINVFTSVFNIYQFFFKSLEFLRTFIITTISKQAFYHDCCNFITINLVFRGVLARENTRIFRIF